MISQQLRQLKKKQERIMHGNVKGMKPVDEDETFFTWEKLFGGQKDYIRESEYHAVWIYLLNSVEKRMKMILADNLELVREESKKHSKRLIELDAVISTELNRGSISRWLQLPIREMENFNELFADKIKEITKRKKIPILVGGTGLYFSTITKGISRIPNIDLKTRDKVRNLFRKLGYVKFYERLVKLDPKVKNKILASDSQRAQRACRCR